MKCTGNERQWDFWGGRTIKWLRITIIVINVNVKYEICV